MRPGRFQSFLAPYIEQFLVHKRALGRRFATEERQLLLLDRYLVANQIRGYDELHSQVLDAFLLSRPRSRPKSFNQLLGVVRRLLDWMVLQEMIPSSPLRAQPRRETGPRPPVIFEPLLVRSLLDLAAQLPDQSRAPLRGASYRLAYALMAGLGLRVGEVSRLRVGDVDLSQMLLWIRESKFRKERLLPFGPHLAEALKDFLALRRKRWGSVSVDAPLLTFNGRRPISANRISSTLQRLTPRLGFPERGRDAPRAHDLRHSFAVGTLLRFYRQGINPSDRLIYLSTFLGHSGVHSTVVYLTITADLLDEANRRFESFATEAIGSTP